MYILGHTAFAYVLIRPFYKYFDIKLEPKMLLLIFIFANLVDAIHFGRWRLAGHNLIGTILFTSFWLIVFYDLKLIDIKHVPILMAASLTHVITDYWFSKYHFLYPLTKEGFVLFGFNTFEALLAGSFFGALLIIIFIESGDLQRFGKFLKKQKMIFKKHFSLRNFYKPKFYLYYLFILFYLFVIGQFVIFLFLNYDFLVQLDWYRWIFMSIYVVWIILIGSSFFMKNRCEDV